MAGTSATDIKVEKRGLRAITARRNRIAPRRCIPPPPLRVATRVIVSTNYRNP